ncbi:MAG: hypothetical protein FWD86_01320 [Firmicutes bacterium]|nr:hypothetical protein [Bacillota bacterium]
MNKQIDIPSQILAAIRADNVQEFGDLVKQRANRGLLFGRFCILALVYCFKAKKIAKLYEAALAKNTEVTERVTEPPDAYKIFKDNAGIFIRVFNDENPISGAEMLAILNEAEYLKGAINVLNLGTEQEGNVVKILSAKRGDARIVYETAGQAGVGVVKGESKKSGVAKGEDKKGAGTKGGDQKNGGEKGKGQLTNQSVPSVHSTHSAQINQSAQTIKRLKFLPKPLGKFYKISTITAAACLSALFALFFVLSILPINFGDGTAQNPRHIFNQSQLLQAANDGDSYFILKNNITLSGHDNQNSPLIDDFLASLDGGNFAIFSPRQFANQISGSVKNLIFVYTNQNTLVKNDQDLNQDSFGIFANTNTGLIENLTVAAGQNNGGESKTITQIVSEKDGQEGGQASENNEFFIGGIVGDNRGSIQNSSFKGNVEVFATASQNGQSTQAADFSLDISVYFGSIAGQNGGQILNSFAGNIDTEQAVSALPSNQNPINQITSNSVLTGGIAAKNQKSGTIENCFNHTEIFVTSDKFGRTLMAGGIAAVNYGLIDSSQNFARIRATSTNTLTQTQANYNRPQNQRIAPKTVYAGGIAAITRADTIIQNNIFVLTSIISNSKNFGDILVNTILDTIYTGGIAAFAEDTTVTVSSWFTQTERVIMPAVEFNSVSGTIKASASEGDGVFVVVGGILGGLSATSAFDHFFRGRQINASSVLGRVYQNDSRAILQTSGQPARTERVEFDDEVIEGGEEDGMPLYRFAPTAGVVVGGVIGLVQDNYIFVQSTGSFEFELATVEGNTFALGQGADGQFFLVSTLSRRGQWTVLDFVIITNTD